MCTASIGAALGLGGLVGGVYSAYKSTSAANKAAEFNASMMQQNAGYAMQNAAYQDFRAGSIIDAGQKAAGLSMRDTMKLQGAQKTGFAASGVAVDSGSANDVYADTMATGLQDVEAIKNNADMDAYEARVQALNYRRQASDLQKQAAFTRKGKTSPWLSAGTALISGGSRLAEKMGFI